MLNTKARCKHITYLLLTILLFVFLLLLLGIHSTGAEDKKNQLYNASLVTMEKDYRQEIRSYLNTNGFENAGITITHVTEDGELDLLLIQIHHKRFAKLSSADTDALLTTLSALCKFEKEVPIRFDIH